MTEQNKQYKYRDQFSNEEWEAIMRYNKLTKSGRRVDPNSKKQRALQQGISVNTLKRREQNSNG